ncbi:MAG: ArnT family glycosyltransferase, partial [Planctomycetota bacterium]
MSDSKAARILFALAALVYLFLQNWTPQEADAEVGFQATRAVALRGEYYLSPDTPGAVLILRTTEPVHGDAYNCRREENGTRQYPYWGLAYITSGVPFYYIGHFLDLAFPTVNEQFAKQSYCAEGIQGSEYFARILVFSMQPLSAALALVFVMIAARRCGASLFAALAASLCFGFCSNLGMQARSGLSDAMAVATVAWAVERAIAAGKSGRAFDAVTLGIALGIGLLIKVHTVFAVAALPIYLICSRESRWNIYRITAGVTAGMAPFLAIFFIANHVRWGSPFITGYEKSTAHAWFLIDPVQGMNALLFSQSKGVLAYAFPTFTLGMAGLIVLFARRMRALPVILFISICVAMLMPASTIEWHGAWSFGPRYALVAFPQLA